MHHHLCRIKFSGTPPSAFKFDGKNFCNTHLCSGGGQKGGGFIETIKMEQLAVLYEIIDFYLQDIDTIKEMQDKIDNFNVRNLFNDYLLMLERSIKLFPTERTLSSIKDTVNSMYKIDVTDFINDVFNLYIDEGFEKKDDTTYRELDLIKDKSKSKKVTIDMDLSSPVTPTTKGYSKQYPSHSFSYLKPISIEGGRLKKKYKRRKNTRRKSKRRKKSK